MENIKAKMVLTLYLTVFYGFVVTNYQSFGGDRGSWVYNRIIIVRCDNVIPENRQDKQLVEHLLEEKEYIVSLAIRCLKQVINNGYKYSIPASCKALNEDYKTENHSFLAFMEECVVDRPSNESIKDKCTTAKMFKVYEAWCRDNNNGYKESKKEVNKILKELGKGEVIKTNGGNTYYKLITLSKEAKKDYENIYNPDKEEDINTDIIDDNFDNKYPTNEDMKYWANNNFGNDTFDDYDDLRPSNELIIELDDNNNNNVSDDNNENI